jgi:hypothetical protein
MTSGMRRQTTSAEENDVECGAMLARLTNGVSNADADAGFDQRWRRGIATGLLLRYASTD